MVKPQTLGLCMIVKDEAADLPHCLDSVAGFINELIVVDTGSKDNTPQIALDYQATLFHFDWVNDFSTARNFSLEKAKSDWILVLDADDVFERDSIPALKKTLEHSVGGVRIRYRNLQPAGELCKYQDQRITRLFRNRPEHRYEGCIHEQITPSIVRNNGIVVDGDITILHYGYTRRTVQGGNQRAQRNLSLLQKTLEHSPQDAYTHFQLGITYKMLADQQQAKKHLEQALKFDQSQFGNDILDEIYMKMAQITLGEDNYPSSIQFAQEGLKQNPDNLVTLYILAISYISLGEIQRAYPLFLKIRKSPVNNLANLDDLDTVINYCQQTIGVNREASLAGETKLKP